MRPQFLDLTNNQQVNPVEYHQAMMCTRLAGRAIIRVVGRCNDAQENENLDLSECQLMQVPDAVFHLMRNTTLKTCDLSGNVITKIPPKLPAKFSCITELNLSKNRMSKLPDECSELLALAKLDISFNAFVSFPKVTLTLPKLEHINMEKNYIADVEAKQLNDARCLKMLILRQNPLKPDVHDALASLSSSKSCVITILLSPKEEDDSWENLDNL